VNLFFVVNGVVQEKLEDYMAFSRDEDYICTSSDFTLSRKSFLEYVIVSSSLECITRNHGFSKGST
jgi:hypothetical protein